MKNVLSFLKVNTDYDFKLVDQKQLSALADISVEFGFVYLVQLKICDNHEFDFVHEMLHKHDRQNLHSQGMNYPTHFC